MQYYFRITFRKKLRNIKTTSDNILQFYAKRVEDAESRAQHHRKKSGLFSNIRLAVFIVGLIAIYFLLKTNIWLMIAYFALCLIVFIYAVIQQEKHDKEVSLSEANAAINRNEITTIQDQKSIFYNGQDFVDGKHHYTYDLDIFGEHSIYPLINRCHTFYGNQHLKNSLTALRTKEDILAVQEGVIELEPEIDWRQDICTKLWNDSENHTINVADILEEELNVELPFCKNGFLRIYTKLILVLWVGLGVAQFLGWSLAGSVAGLLFIINLGIVGAFTKQISAIHGKLSSINGVIKNYIEVLEVIMAKKWQSSYLQDLYNQNQQDTNGSIVSLKQLSSILNRMDYRLNFLIAIVGNGIFLMDIVHTCKFAQWKEDHQGSFASIFDFIGKIEWVSSLANWAFNHPENSYPQLIDDYIQIDAAEVAHPLLEGCVPNDFHMDPNDKSIIITGSNMSGKSTFLRTIGLNMVLAYAGTKVVAKNMAVPVVHLVSYMRIKDALEENVSTFKAELNRISMILELIEKEEKVLILIDEMLRGTNSKDKLVGSMKITQKLLDSKAFAMIATHDIQLAEMGADNEKIANYFFDISFHKDELMFDYKIKKGICDSFNASFLLGKLGL